MPGPPSPPPRRWSRLALAQGLAALACWGALAGAGAAEFEQDVEGRLGALQDGRREVQQGGDGVPDGEQDFNNDGVPDGQEDRNNDGFQDGTEDRNNNGTPDGTEDRRTLDPERQEVRRGPDGIPDGEQDFNNDGTPDGEQDLNRDGFPDGTEDRNADGILDGQEDRRGLEPREPSPTPQPDTPLGSAVQGAVETAENQLSFRADVQRSFDEEETIELEGNVLITYQGTRFYADYVRINDREKVFYGVGHAKLEMPDRTIEGESFWYDYDKEDFLIEGARGFVLASGLGEPLYFKSRVARGNVADFKLINTILTTCTPDERQEWHIKAGMVKVQRDHKVKLRNAIFYILGVPVFWFPYYEVSLEETPILVSVYKNRTEGTVVEVTFPYLYEPERYLFGSLTAAYRSRLGFELGTDHRYALHGYNWDGTLRTNTEFVTENEGIDLEYSFQANQRFALTRDITGNVNLSQNSTVNQQAGNRTENAAAGFTLTRQTQGGDNTSITYNFTQQKLTTTNSSSTARLSHTHDFTKKLKFNGQANYTSSGATQGLANDQRLELQANLTGDTQGPITWRAEYRQTIDPDGNRVAKLNEEQISGGGGNTQPDPADPGTDTPENRPPGNKLVDPDEQSQFLNHLPEIHISLRPGALGEGRENPLGVETQKFDLTLAHYIQQRPEDRINTVFAELDTSFRRSFLESETNRLEATMGYRQSFTGTGDALYTVSPGVTWSRKESNNLEQNFRWSYNDTEGSSPITNQTGGGNSSNLTYDLNYRTPKLTWGVNTGRNFKDNTWSPITFRSTWTPNPGVGDFNLTFSSGYDLEMGRLRPFVWQAQYTNFDLRLRSTINWTYDLRDSQTQQLTAQTDWFIRRDLDTTFRLAYDTVGRNRDILQELSLTKRFDCTFMQLTYRAQGDVFLLQAGVTAYPGQTIGYGLNADTLLNNPFAQFGDNLGATPGGFTGFGNTFGTGGFDTGF